MKTLVIDKQAFKSNIEVVKRLAGGVPVYAVLTGDACGVGLVESARLLREESITRYAVSEPEDAERLRSAGFTDEEILMLRASTDRAELEQLMDLNVVCTVGSYETALALNGLAESRGTVAEAHLQIDSGMGYGGFLLNEMDKILSVYRYLSNVAISGIYTQLRSAGKKDSAQDLSAFQAVVAKLREEGFEPGVSHVAGSSALFLNPDLRLDAVRIGSAFFGRTRLSARKTGLHPVGNIEAQISEVRWLPKGHTVGNELPVTLKKPTRVAVIPLGYYNGITAGVTQATSFWAALRRWRGEGHFSVQLGTKKARVIGRPGMLETIVDVTNLDCTPGDLARFPADTMFVRGMKRVYR